jgi:hypothetical protein
MKILKNFTAEARSLALMNAEKHRKSLGEFLRQFSGSRR